MARKQDSNLVEKPYLIMCRNIVKEYKKTIEEAEGYALKMADKYKVKCTIYQAVEILEIIDGSTISKGI